MRSRRAATGEHDALVDDVGGQLRRRLFERGEDGFDDRVNRLRERLAYLVAVDDDRLRNACHEVAPFDFGRQLLFERMGIADLNLDALRGLLADRQVVLSLEVGGDGVVHLVSPDANTLGIDDSRERDDGDLGRASPDVYDHVAARLGDREPRANRGGHGLFDQIDLARSRALRALFDSTLHDLGDAEWNANHDARLDQG